MYLCEYGCGNIAKNKTKGGKNICSTPQSCPVNRKKNGDANKLKYANGERKSAKSVYNDLSQESKNKMAWNRGKNYYSIEEKFVEHSIFSSSNIKETILKNDLLEKCCDICKITNWNNKEIILELDHINGINKDNRLENLRFLCPNCHSQTDNWRGRNKNNGKLKNTDEEILNAFKICGNIRKTLLFLDVAAKGGNYARVKDVLNKNNIKYDLYQSRYEEYLT